MLYWLIELSDKLTVLNVFRYITFRTGGAVITASHNPYQFNGFKYKTETGSAVPSEVIAELERNIATLDDVPAFLYRLFSDPDVIRVRSALLRKGIAAAIALGRKKASRALYASIGGGSPDSNAMSGEPS